MLQLDVPKSARRSCSSAWCSTASTSPAGQGRRILERGRGHSSGRKWPVVLRQASCSTLRSFRALPPPPSSRRTRRPTTAPAGSARRPWQMITHHGNRQPYEEKPPAQWEQWDKTRRLPRLLQRRRLDRRRPCGPADEGEEGLEPRTPSSITATAGCAPTTRTPRSGGSSSGRRRRRRPTKPFVDAMWAAYRKTVPEQESAGNPTKWVWGADGKGKMGGEQVRPAVWLLAISSWPGCKANSERPNSQEPFPVMRIVIAPDHQAKATNSRWAAGNSDSDSPESKTEAEPQPRRAGRHVAGLAATRQRRYPD